MLEEAKPHAIKQMSTSRLSSPLYANLKGAFHLRIWFYTPCASCLRKLSETVIEWIEEQRKQKG